MPSAERATRTLTREEVKALVEAAAEQGAAVVALTPAFVLALLRDAEQERFSADDVLVVHAVGCWDGVSNVNRPTPEQQQREHDIVWRARRARSAAAASLPEEPDNG
jgi:hypothetical protein